MGCSVHSCLDAGDRYTTIELKVNYLKALTAGHRAGAGIATIVNISRTVALAEARLVDRDGTLYAHGTSTCLIKRGGFVARARSLASQSAPAATSASVSV